MRPGQEIPLLMSRNGGDRTSLKDSEVVCSARAVLWFEGPIQVNLDLSLIGKPSS